MRITQLIPGTGSYICGSCLRDNTLASALRARGNDVLAVPLYLPFKLEQTPMLRDRVFLGGINMYLLEKAPVLRVVPTFLTRLLDSPMLLRWTSRRGDMIDPHQLGRMTTSMLRGEDGRQARELDRLVAWLEQEPQPDVLLLSNVMLSGMARRLKERFDVPIVCTMQGEAPFLDALPERHRDEAWRILTDRAADVDAFIAVSRYHGDDMTRRMSLPPERVHVVHNGIELDGLAPDGSGPPDPPAVGYLARLCEDKGLHTLVEAFRRLKQEPRFAALKLRVAGAMLPDDEAFVAKQRERLAAFGDDVEITANIDREAKQDLLHSITVLSVPATYGESFGLYILEALAAGVPVVQPRHAAFPEVLEATGGGILCEPDDPRSLADGLAGLLDDRERAAALAERGRKAVLDRFQSDHMAAGVERVCRLVAHDPATSAV